LGKNFGLASKKVIKASVSKTILLWIYRKVLMRIFSKKNLYIFWVGKMAKNSSNFGKKLKKGYLLI